MEVKQGQVMHIWGTDLHSLHFWAKCSRSSVIPWLQYL